VGDGAIKMNGMGEFVTIAKYWRRWADPCLVVLMLSNRDLAYVTWEQRVQAGDPKIDAAQQLPDLPYAGIAELIGLRDIWEEEPEGVDPAWAEALAADRPVVLDMVTDPNVPPLPPHVTLKQAHTFAHALFTGEPDTTSMLVNTAREMVGALLPGGAKG